MSSGSAQDRRSVIVNEDHGGSAEMKRSDGTRRVQRS
jgi:hypothetical protein